MEKKLPSIFANPIQKKMGNVQETFYGSGSERKSTNYQTIESKIQSIFSSRNFVYKSRVRIVTNDKDEVYTLVGKTGKSLLTIDGKTIPISSIIDIESI